MVDPDETGAVKSEAQSQSEETVMPWIWGGVGVVVIAVFVAWTFLGGPHGGGAHGPIRQPPAAAPPPAQRG